jgi:hypothetical protein
MTGKAASVAYADERETKGTPGMVAGARFVFAPGTKVTTGRRKWN